MIFRTTFAFTVCASRTFRILFDTLSKCYSSKNSFFTMFRASWIPFVPSTSRITDICPNSIPSMFGCHIICLPYVGYFFRQLSSIIQCWRWLKILEIIFCCEVCLDFCATIISLQFVSTTKNFWLLVSILIFFYDILTKNSIIFFYQRRKLKFYGCLILSYRKQNSKCLIFVMLNLTIFEHLGN